MKKTFVLFVAFATQISIAQNVFPASGNVGIGTTNPNSRLVVMNDGYGVTINPGTAAAGLGFNRNALDGAIFNASVSAWQFSARDGMFTLEGYNGAQHELFSVLKNGNVGIGTFAPNAKLYVGGGDVIIHNPTGSAISTGVLRGDNFNYGNGGAIRFSSSNTVSEQYIQLGRATSGSGAFFPQLTVMSDNGNVGIGTTNPNAKLYVGGGDVIIHNPTGNAISTGVLRGDNFNYGNGGAIRFSSSNTVSEQYIQFGEAQSGTGNFTPIMTVLGTIAGGKVGIGTNPHNTGDKLHVDGGDFLISKDAGGGVTHGIIRGDNANYGNGGAIRFSSSNTVSEQYIQFGEAQSGTGAFTPIMTVLGTIAGGKVGIGTSNPNNKLDVNGTIHSKEVKVDMTGWSDFVFKKEYNLQTLEEVEKQITEKGHLANIPSEKEVLKNGINLGEMNAKLLQKIEEMTLYMIEMKKENVQLKNKQEELEKKVLLLTK